MDFPERHFPVNICPHNRESGRRRLNFVGYGSHSQVDSADSDTTDAPKCYPQKGLGVIDGLPKNLPALPLYEEPIKECHEIQDYILGVDHFDETMQSMQNFLHSAGSAKAEFQKGQEELILKVNKCEQLVDACLTEKNATEHFKKLKEELPFWTISLLKNYSKASTAFNDDCLMGYNRDFYQGLLCHKQTASSTLLFHAAGNGFRDVYMTEVMQDDGGLPLGRQTAKINLKKPIFQIKSSKKESEGKGGGLICARQKEKCVVLTFDESICGLDKKQAAGFDSGQPLSDVELSPFNAEEVLLSAKNGEVVLWNICSASCQPLLHKKPNVKSKGSWTSSQFAGHPRQLVVSDCTSVAMFDHRDRFQTGLELFSLSTSFVKSHELVMATESLGFPYHLVASDYSLFLVDQRFPGTPVFHWGSESITAPQLVQVCRPPPMSGAGNSSEDQCYVFVGTQQPAEVVCYPLHLAKNSAPVSKTLPWRVGKYGDFCGYQHTSYRPQWFEMEKRFESSLAGMTVVDQSSQRQQMLSVFQMDGYGDIFFKNFKFSQQILESGCYKLVPTTVEERVAADKRTTKFLSALDSIQKNKASSVEDLGEESSLNCRDVSDFLRGVYEPTSSKEENFKKEAKKSGLTFYEFERNCCSRNKKNLKAMYLFPASKCNTKLLLALKEKTDITEIIKEREKDHLEKKTILHERYIRNKIAKQPKIDPRRKERIQKRKRKNAGTKEEEERDDNRGNTQEVEMEIDD